MRIFWISLTLVIVFMLFSVCFSYILEEGSSKIVTRIEDMEKKIDANDWEGIQKDLDILRKKWDGMNKLWSAFIEHSELDNIEVSLLKADEYISMNDEVLTRAELSVLKYLVRHIYIKEKVELVNVF